MQEAHGIDSMPETAENVAADCRISRDDQDAFALRSQTRAAAAIAAGRLAEEIVPVAVPQRKGDAREVARDEHPRRIDPGGARRAAADRPAGRHGHGGQRVRRQRRRVRAA